ncbi:MAG: hypothetical protein RMJ48_06660 [Roseiflexaceae bacterium]|nr:hypothetical protein [Roseiflexaceae bacterium]
MPPSGPSSRTWSIEGGSQTRYALPPAGCALRSLPDAAVRLTIHDRPSMIAASPHFPIVHAIMH